MLIIQQQYSANEILVVIFWVELRCCDVEGPLLWIAVVEGEVLRQQVHVMHGHVVTQELRLQEADVDQTRTVESAGKMPHTVKHITISIHKCW